MSTKKIFNFSTSKESIFLCIPLFCFLISTMEAMTNNVNINIIRIGNSTIWLVAFLVTSIIVLNKNLHYKVSKKFNNAYIILVCYIMLMSLLYIPFDEVGSRQVYVGLICYLTCFLSFRNLSIQDKLQQGFTQFLWACLIILIFIFISSRTQLVSLFDEDIVLSSAYIILYLFPITMLFSDKKMKLIYAGLVLLLLFFSNKRGAVITGFVSVLSFFVVNMLFIQNKKGRKILPTVSVFIGLYVIYLLIYKLIESSDLFIVNRIALTLDDEGSGRVEIWKAVLSGFEGSSVFELLFGHGLESVRGITGGSTAHNDYLEILYDYGIIAFLIYISFIFILFTHSIQLIKNKSHLAPSFFSSFLLFSLPSFFSHIVIYPHYFLTFSMYWGVVVGLEESSHLQVT